MSLHAMLSRSAHVSLRHGQLCISGNPPRSLPIEDLDTLTLEDGERAEGSGALSQIPAERRVLYAAIFDLCRICSGMEAADKHEQRLKNNLPEHGSVRLLRITEQQYTAMRILCGNPSPDLDIDHEKMTVLTF